MRLKLLVLLVLCGVTVQACGDDSESSPPPISVNEDAGPRGGTGGPFIPHGGTGGDDKGGAGDEDGGADTGGTGGSGGAGGMGGGADGPSNCRDFDAVPPFADPDPTMLANVVTRPTDLAVTRASATWDANCAQPTLRVTISSGDCPSGDGHELTFFVPAEGVEDNTILLGQNVIMADAVGHIRVRYTRPGRLTPSGQWGTCEDASGTVDLVGELELIRRRTLQGTFILDLTRCDDGTPSVQQLEGSFNVEVPASLSDACP